MDSWLSIFILGEFHSPGWLTGAHSSTLNNMKYEFEAQRQEVAQQLQTTLADMDYFGVLAFFRHMLEGSPSGIFLHRSVPAGPC